VTREPPYPAETPGAGGHLGALPTWRRFSARRFERRGRRRGLRRREGNVRQPTHCCVQSYLKNSSHTQMIFDFSEWIAEDEEKGGRA